MSRTFSLTMMNKENQPSLNEEGEEMQSPPPRKPSTSKASTSSRAKPKATTAPATKAKPAAKPATKKTSRVVSAAAKVEYPSPKDGEMEQVDNEPTEEPPSSLHTSRKRTLPADPEPEDKPVPHKRVASGQLAPKEEDKEPGNDSAQWQAKFDVLIQEKEALQAQFDELYELRHTKAEKLYHSLKKASDDRDRHARETIDNLRQQLNVGGVAPNTPAPAPAVDPAEATAEDPKTGQHLTAQEAVDLLIQEREERDATQKLLDVEVANSKALLARSKPGASTATGTGLNTKAEGNPTAQVDAEASRAIRCLYEDLTGIVIRSVDRLGEDNRPMPLAPGDADTHNLRFRALFAADGFFPIEFVMQSYPSDGSNPLGRLRFVPALRPDEREEDARIVKRLKEEGASFLAKPLWFGRDAAPRFLSHFLNSYDREAQVDE